MANEKPSPEQKAHELLQAAAGLSAEEADEVVSQSIENYEAGKEIPAGIRPVIEEIVRNARDCRIRKND